MDRKVSAHNAKHSDSPITVAYFFDHFASAEDTAVVVTEDDFIAAKQELVPSVSFDELGHYERVRKTFEGDAKKSPKEDQDNEPRAASYNSAALTTRPSQPFSDIRKASGGSISSKGRAKGKGKGNISLNNYPDSTSDSDVTAFRDMDRDNDDDEEYVIRTDHLKSNGATKSPELRIGGNTGSGKGKGKGAAPAKLTLDGFGDPAAEDEENLYS